MTSLPPQDQELVFRHLEELGDAPILSRSPRLLVLLDFLVRETLFGRGHTLKELVIGDALYSSTHPYDPGADSSVRVEVGRLRRKLDAHYAAASHRVPVRITLPKGSYRPEISVDRETRATPATGMMPRSDLAIIPFRMLGDGELGKSFASSLTDETIFSIERVARLKLAPRMIVFQLGDIPFNFADAAAFARARMLLHATVRCVGPNIRVTVELCDTDGPCLWSKRFDDAISDTVNTAERLAQQIATAIPYSLICPAMRPTLAVVG